MTDKNLANFFDRPVKRRDILKMIGLLPATGLINSALPGIPFAAPRDKHKRPNIIFILSDNTRWNFFGHMGHPFIRTPGLDRLASEGLVFENAFNTTSLCSPSRASILTGAYPHNHGVLNNHTAWTGQKTTFLEHLSRAGYDTAFIGKWHMPGEGLPEMPFLDKFVSFTYREGQGSYYNCPLIVDGQPTPSRKEYLTEELTDHAIEFIQNKKQTSARPFCLYLSHKNAHPPYIPPKDIKGMYADAELSLPKGVDAWFSKTNGNVFQGIMMGSYEKQYRGYCEIITAMDRQIERLLARIDDLGLRDNTLVIYMGDNGMSLGEHRHHGIREAYEEVIRLPFVVRCPWLIPDPGSRRSQMVLNLDIATSLLDIAGIPIPHDMDGASIAPWLRSGLSPGRKACLLEFWKYFPENTPSYCGVRTPTHKYIKYEKGRQPELYDLAQDPREQRNLYGTPQADCLLPELESMLQALKNGTYL